jgi:hypothetical protein
LTVIFYGNVLLTPTDGHRCSLRISPSYRIKRLFWQ